MTPTAIKPAPLCGKGTRNGEAASVSRYGFAPCILREGHYEPCDSGPAPDGEPTRRAA
jgi:hypothetical protein